MTYISAIMKRDDKGFINSDEVLVWECIDGKNVLKRYPGVFEFYVRKEDGEYTSVYNEKLTKYEFDTYTEFRQARKYLLQEKNLKLYESDISPDTKVLSKHYYEKPSPKLNVLLYDIEVDYKTISYGNEFVAKARMVGSEKVIDTSVGEIRNLSSKQQLTIEVYDPKNKYWKVFPHSNLAYEGPVGFSSPQNPYAPINAISIYKQWEDKSIVMAVPPPGFDLSTIDQSLHGLTEIRFYKNEKELLLDYLEELEEASIISGWNSAGFDDPYVARRVEMILGYDHFKRLSFEGANSPAFRELFVKGAKQLRVDYSGRIQLDYLELFKKFEGGERASFRLEAVAEDHLPHLKKLTYPGSLEQLYTNDFNHFLRYNIRDTEILKGFEAKLTYIQLANDMVHSSTNQFNHIFGTVRMVDNAIVNYCHYEIDRIVPDRWETRDGKIQGAYVLFPQRGLHKWICSIDINSLYPSAIRSINISPETVIGQFENNIKDWVKIYEGIEDDITIKYDDGTYETKKTQEWVNYFAEQCWAVSGYGTVFSQKELGIIPSLLAKWYSQRKVYQAEMRKYVKEAEALKYDFSTGHAVARKDYDEDLYFELTEKGKFYNRLQYIFKIKLNSTYGCLSNFNFRFFRLELGESTTGTSRQILRHQCRQTNYIIDGEYNIDFPIYESMAIIDNINKETSKRLAEEADEFGFDAEEEEEPSRENMSLSDLVDLESKEYYHAGFVTHEMALDGPVFNGKFSSQVVVYGDTDSTYFTVPANNKEEAIAYADAVAEAVNKSYPAFMRKAFHCQPEYDLQVKCGREVVSDHGLFVEKKRYILHVVDNEGETVDKMKIMGLDIKKTTLPKIISAKLTDFIRRLLYGEDWKSIAIDIVVYKEQLMAFDNLIDVGLPKNVNNLEKYEMVYRVDGVKARLPGNVAAALHFNERLKEYDDHDTEVITSGTKIRVYYLKNKMLGKFTSIALPSDIEHIPDWFTDNFVPQIDKEKQLSRLVDNPLQNILKAIDVAVPTAQTVHADELFSF